MASTPPDQEADQMAAAAAAAIDDDLTYDPLVDGGDLEQELQSDCLHNPDIPTSPKQLEETPEAERKENKHGTHDYLKATLIFSGMVIAMVGAIFAVLKKTKEA